MNTRQALVSIMIALGIAATLAFAARAPATNNTGEEMRTDNNNDDRHAPITWRTPQDIATGDAHRGPWRMNRSEFNFVDDPTVAINTRGEIAIAWADHPQQDIFFQRFNTNGEAQLNQPINISRSANIFSWLPKIIITDDDPAHIYALWQDIVFSGGSHGGEIFFAKSTDAGETFGEPINLSNTTAGAGKGRLTARSWHNGSLDIARGPQGNIYAAWTEYEGRLHFATSTDGGETFSDPILLAGGEGDNPARGPDFAVGKDGTIHLAWTIGEDNAANIHYARSTDRGESFSEPRPIHESDGHADAPKLAIDHNGTLHLVYAESPNGMFRQSHVRYTRLQPGAESFDEPRDITGKHRNEFASVGFPALSVDGENSVYVIWELYPSLRGRPHGLGITHSPDAGDTFAAPAIIPGTDDRDLGFSGSQQGLLMRKLAVNDAGAIAVVNSFFNDGEESRVRLIRRELRRADAEG